MRKGIRADGKVKEMYILSQKKEEWEQINDTLNTYFPHFYEDVCGSVMVDGNFKDYKRTTDWLEEHEEDDRVISKLEEYLEELDIYVEINKKNVYKLRKSAISGSEEALIKLLLTLISDGLKGRNEILLLDVPFRHYACSEKLLKILKRCYKTVLITSFDAIEGSDGSVKISEL